MSTPLSSTDPKVLAGLAGCFNSCVPTGYQNALKTYLLTQLVQSGAPGGVCVTPTAPVSVGIGQEIGDTMLGVRWLQPANTGSLILSYTVKMGTILGGPYPLIQTVGASVRHVEFTGLTPGTTYYAVVIANSFSGCSSVNSNEASGATTGASLMTGLLAYWKMDEAGASATYADATGNGWTGAAMQSGLPTTFNAIAGIINNAANLAGGTDGMEVSTAIDTRASTTPFTIQVWLKYAATATPASNVIVGEFVPAPNFYCQFNLAANSIIWTGTQTDTTRITVDSLVNLTIGVWAHIVCGFDGSNVWIQINNSVRQQAAVTDVIRGGQPLIFGNRGDYLEGVNGSYDEMGYWGRSLSTAEVTSLYNSGNALPFSSF